MGAGRSCGWFPGGRGGQCRINNTLMNSTSKLCPNCKGALCHVAEFADGPRTFVCFTCKGAGVVPTEDRPEPEGGQPAVTQAARRSLPALAKVLRRVINMRDSARDGACRYKGRAQSISAHFTTAEGVLNEVISIIAEAQSEEPEGNEQS